MQNSAGFAAMFGRDLLAERPALSIGPLVVAMDDLKRLL